MAETMTLPVVVEAAAEKSNKHGTTSQNEGAASTSRRKRRSGVNLQLYNSDYEYSRASMKKMKSKKKGRRFENLCHLLSLFKDDIMGDDDYDLDDLVDFSQNSLFYDLFQNDSYLQKWYMFLSKSGEEQDKVLEELDKETAVESDSDSDDYGQCSSEEERSELKEMALEQRLEFGDQAFNKIDKNIKPVLKRQFSLEYLLKYENQIIPVFESKQTGDEHCIQNIENGMERMIVHGLCQYLEINSKSYRRNDGTILKMIKTENGKFIIPPPILLSEFLRKRFFSTTKTTTS